MRVQRLLRVVGIFRLLRVDRLAPLRKRRSDYVEITTKNNGRNDGTGFIKGVFFDGKRMKTYGKMM